MVGNAANDRLATAMAPGLDLDAVLKELRIPGMDQVAAIESLHVVALDRGLITQRRD